MLKKSCIINLLYVIVINFWTFWKLELTKFASINFWFILKVIITDLNFFITDITISFYWYQRILLYSNLKTYDISIYDTTKNIKTDFVQNIPFSKFLNITEHLRTSKTVYSSLKYLTVKCNRV